MCMTTPKTFDEDLAVARSILKRDNQTTRDFMYKKCYPLFKSIYNNYFTDSSNVHEFIDEVYLLILTPSKHTGRCQLESYRGESSLSTWLKAVCLSYCYRRYRHKEQRPVVVGAVPGDGAGGGPSDRPVGHVPAIAMDNGALDCADIDAILNMMPNERYRDIIRLRYFEHRSNEEVALALSMCMGNYYNKHKLAKAQFVETLKKEDEK